MIAVVSHDAGGAEILSSWILRSQESFCLALSGPAVLIFRRKLGELPNYPLESAIEMCDWVLCGTSWQSPIEKQAIVQAAEAGKRAIVFIDHWVNYAERFQLGNVTVLPDEIWVGDEYAEALAIEIFPEVRITLRPNPYFDDIKKSLKNDDEKRTRDNHCRSPNTVLYVCEPIREHALLTHGDERYWGYTEEEALEFFLNHIDALNSAVSQVTIRPHPSEDSDKYNWVKIKYPSVIQTKSTKTLTQQIVEADVVVGCESMALVVGLMAGKRVISSIPAGGKKCGLPHEKIEHLQKMVSQIGNSIDG
jgi:hypothetical protein